MSAASDDFLYRSEVLQLDSGQTESAVDDQLLREARALGIAKSHSHTSTPIATSESAVTLPTLPIRSGSITSQATESTGLTSRSSHELRHPSQPVAPASPSRRRTFNAKSLVVTEYEKFLANAQAQDRSTSARGRKPPPVPSIPRSNSTPSIISATSRRSSYSVKRGLSRFTKLSKSKKIHAGLTCVLFTALDN
ncbi:MAG: hypothetical protein M1827_007450 [Pycnora praestabilis]|nr:MAG: hypothetical protein M1827_007450 [Pycnora praestabilis]